MVLKRKSRTLAALSLSAFLLIQPVCGLLPGAMAADVLKGTVIKVDENQTPTVNPEEVKVVQKGTPLDLMVNTEINIGVSESGDEFFGKMTKDVVVDGKVVIPRDTLVHGVIGEISPPKRAGRNGYAKFKFDYLITPDGREIPITGDFSSKENKAKAIAKGVARATGYTAVGGAVGALLVLRYGGLAAVAASNGYALAGGAAIGGAVGLTSAMVRKGKNYTIEPGSNIQVSLQEGLELPAMNMPDAEASNIQLDGLDVKVTGMRVGKDPFGELTEITLSLDITNKTENSFSFFDIALLDENGTAHYASPFGDTGMWFKKMAPNAHVVANMSFNVDNPKLRHELVFYKQYTRQPLAKIALTDMMLDKKALKKVK